MISFTFAEALTVVGAVIIAGLVSYPISGLLSNINKKLVFFIPAALAILAAILWVLGLTTQDLGAIGYILYGSFATIACVGSLIASLILWKRKQNQSA